MKIKIYDSVKQKKLNLNESNITIYNCGPTVYNDIHIGNLRPPLTFDIFLRFLKLTNKKVKYVHNLTDIDDKIIQKALLEKQSELEISQKYAKEYLKIWKAMNFLKPTKMPKVSDNINGIINYIKKLTATKFVYFNKNDVLFDVRALKNYGIISKQKVDHLKNQSREIKFVDKKSDLDFVLWKQTDQGLNWKTSWSTGRPGWHTECSYFINKYVGKQVTIHGGGIDLKFPHHENENAQNLALHKCNLAKIWMHIAPVNINDEKMSKSLNNFILVKDILSKYSSNAVRFLFLQTHYRNNLNFSWEKMDLAEKEMTSFNKTINLAKTHLVINKKKFVFKTQKLDQEIVNYLKDDLNFANVLKVFYDWKNLINVNIKNKDWKKVAFYLNKLVLNMQSLGFSFLDLHKPKVIQMIQNWQEELKNKNFVKADKLRKKLINKNVW